MRLKHKVVLITGAGGGIGRTIAVRCAQEGARIVVNDINSRLINEVTNDIETRGGDVLGVDADVSNGEEVRRMVQKSLDYFGKIDILVNNAGIITFANIFNLTEEEWDSVFAVNARGVFLCSKAVIPHMAERKKGKIISISSIAGKTGGPYAAHYAASKFAVIGFTQVLARELAPYKIHVNAVCPGFIETKMLELFEEKQAHYLGLKKEDIKRDYIERSGWDRMGTPKDVANLVVFLASAEADYITGQAINVCAAGEFH